MIKLNRKKLPRHIAIIMDGNGRWAERRGLSRIEGHRIGIESVRAIIRACSKIGIKYLTLYTFSTENWRRPRDEVDALMHMIEYYCIREREELLKEGVRFLCIGDIERIPGYARRELAGLVKATARNRKLTLVLALSYGAREEILHAVNELGRKIAAGRLSRVTERIFSNHLFTSGIPDPDLLVRTSGEFRISNFLLWQIAYSELYITRTLWPDFREPGLRKAISSYQRRERRFGRTGAQIRKGSRTH
jgi:undecaprenyl diphosphate synthase